MKQTSKMVRQLSNYSCQQVVLKSCRSKYSAQETSQKLCKRGLELVKTRLLSTIQPQRDLLLKRHKHMICKYPYSPKERFLKEPHLGVPFVLVLSFIYVIDFKFWPPYDTNFSMSYCDGCGVGRIFFRNIFASKYRVFFPFF